MATRSIARLYDTSDTARAAVNALEAAGFSLPEPIYRLRFNASLEQALERFQGESPERSGSDAPVATADTTPEARGARQSDDAHPARARAKRILQDPGAEALFDARPDDKLKEKVEQEIAQNADETDLLNSRAPKE